MNVVVNQNKPETTIWKIKSKKKTLATLDVAGLKVSGTLFMLWLWGRAHNPARKQDHFSKPHFCIKNCFGSRWWSVCWFFRQKWTRRQVGWICQLEVVLTSDNHYFFLLHIIWACDNKWCSCEHQNCLQYTVAGYQPSTFWCPLTVYPDNAAPGDLTQKKNLAKFLPRTRLSTRKRAGQNNKQH